MPYEKVNYHNVEEAADGLHFLREPLGCEQLGISVLECEPGWTGKEHTHVDREHEEVYLLVDGAATVTVNDEEVPMESGDALRLPPEATRQIQNGDAESLFVLAGAP
ncbi:cupin domain-containing protein [Haladaptatus pallidirubidus]|uniref:Cupin type-2 domain-containing protein n=1 Tax=Haladaptatus pallidirubidus TaxID=1008152 RepID=A0AAV3UR47_9EURY|nr:cupin domain-containing protein [Haladaptatus pallidirubidus]